MGLFDKMNQVSKSVTETSRSAAETSNLKKKIAYEKRTDSGDLSGNR